VCGRRDGSGGDIRESELKKGMNHEGQEGTQRKTLVCAPVGYGSNVERWRLLKFSTPNALLGFSFVELRVLRGSRVFGATLEHTAL
jgi:hypothetical protein